jgi:hypothetical protein
VILVDRDDDDCRSLKERIATVATATGFRRGGVDCLIRIAVEELEAWLLGDPEALRNAYPRLPANMGAQAATRDPDAVTGGTWETLERLLQRAGYFNAGLPKIELARTVAPLMDPSRNTSRSFQVFRDAITARCGPTVAALAPAALAPTASSA